MILALIGPDGVGKTTIAIDLTKKLQNLNYTVEFNKDFEEYFLLKYILNLKVLKRESIANNYFYAQTKKPNLIIKNLWPTLVWLDQLLLFIFIFVFKRNNIVVTDRYPYSFWVTWEYYSMSNKLISLLFQNFPKPTHCFILSNSPEVLYKRKAYQKILRGNSYQLEFFRKHKELYELLADKLKLHILETANMTVDEISNLLVNRITVN